jgi:peroxiredoxin
MRRDWERFRAAGLGIVVVTLGTPGRVAEFAQEWSLPFPLLADPRRQAYAAYGLGKLSFRHESNITSAARAASAALRYGVAREAEQDMLQLGGVFVVDTEGVIRYTFRAERAAEFPPSDELLRVAAQLGDPVAIDQR